MGLSNQADNGGVEMNISIRKLTDDALMRRACEMTMRGQSKMTLETMYACKHSPIRTQLFWVEMHGIPTFASVHLVRHNVGVTHYVQSNREDRGGDENANRWTPVNHAMLINAEALQNLAYKRLCHKAHKDVRGIMRAIKEVLAVEDRALADTLVPLCEWRNGLCSEPKPCGWFGGRQ